jgi:vanadium chloroperoxidase
MDPILYWNEVALEANRKDFSGPGAPEQGGPTLSSRAQAIVHLAMYDAYAGVIKDPVNLPPYLPGLPAPGAGASADAAVAYAAHETLSKLFPSQKSTFDQKLTGAGLSGPGVNAGRDFGLLVAGAILEDRKNDPSASDAGYTPSNERGRHRVDPDNPGQGFHAPFYGAKSKGFAITKRHELKKPPKPGDGDYTKALREVRAKGIAPELMGTLPLEGPSRSMDETVIGIYWGYDGAVNLGTPPRLYNQIVRVIAKAKNNSVAENARLFALVNAAMGDAGILAWDQKYIHDFWRPVVGIREHDKSMGPAATAGTDNLSDDCDPFWLPLGAPNSNRPGKNFTPPFPAYPSGHATFGAAALHMTRLFYGVTGTGSDDLFKGLTFVSDEFNGVTQDNKGTVRPRHVRNFDGGLWQMIEENGRSRVFLGVHWVFDAFALDHFGRPDLSENIGGVPLGLKIAEDIFNGGREKGLKKSTVGPR